jgi:outer membrane protein OmpA-like peptidoglycan-associated protein
MKMKNLLVIALIFSFFGVSCGNSKGFGKKRYTTSTYSKPKFKTTTYNGQKGTKNINIFNKKQAKREKDFVETLEKAERALKLAEEQKNAFAKLDSTESVKILGEKLQQSFVKTQELINNLNNVNPYTAAGHQQALTLASELNDLLYSQILPLGELVSSNMQIKRLGADIGFKTGSAILSIEGVNEITRLIDSMIVDINSWKKYLNHHNQTIFKNEEYRTIIVINGYSDKQGSGSKTERERLNKELSENRAKAVASEFEKQLVALKKKYKLDYQITFVGHGENLPPSFIDSGKKMDEKRRVSSISLVVGPKILLINE